VIPIADSNGKVDTFVTKPPALYHPLPVPTYGPFTAESYKDVARTNYKVWVMAFNLPMPLTVGQVCGPIVDLSDNRNGRGAAGIYDLSGNLLASTAMEDIVIPTVHNLVQGASVTLAAGTYFYAYATHDGAMTNFKLRSFSDATLANLFYYTSTSQFLFGTAANAATSGGMPATLGALTRYNGTAIMPLIILATA